VFLWSESIDVQIVHPRYDGPIISTVRCELNVKPFIDRTVGVKLHDVVAASFAGHEVDDLALADSFWEREKDGPLVYSKTCREEKR